MKKAAEYILIAIGLLIALVIIFSVSLEIKTGDKGFVSQSKTEFTSVFPDFF